MENIIIIGSGLAGLSTAIELLDMGRGVTILERYKVCLLYTSGWRPTPWPRRSGWG